MDEPRRRGISVRRVLNWADNALLVAVVGGGAWLGVQQLATDDKPPAVVRSAAAGSHATALDRLDVKGRAPKTGYARDKFGRGWVDVDRNGCDTRNDILQRDLTDVELRAGNNCVVERGQLVDPYSGKSIAFQKGNKTSTAVQIDHVVALSDAWQKGAQSWTDDKRTQFANDPRNLLAIGQATNQSKGDGDAATWLPPKKAFRCAYVSKQIEVKAAYGLWITAAEREVFVSVLSACD